MGSERSSEGPFLFSSVPFHHRHFVLDLASQTAPDLAYKTEQFCSEAREVVRVRRSHVGLTWAWGLSSFCVSFFPYDNRYFVLDLASQTALSPDAFMPHTVLIRGDET